MSLLLLLLLALATLIYFANRHFFGYWSRRGLAHNRPTFLVGNVADIFLLKRSFGEYFESLYLRSKQHRALGFYLSYRPAVLVVDPQLASDILVRDFASFHDRGITINEQVDPLAAHLFMLSGQRWRDLRVKLSPLFTSGKLRAMFPTIRDCAHELQAFFERKVAEGSALAENAPTFDVLDLFARFTTSVISSVAFGLDNDCINERDNAFRQMGAKIFEPTAKRAVAGLLGLFAPKLYRALELKQVASEVEEFFMKIVRETVEFREREKVTRNDLMQLLIQLKNDGFVAADRGDESEIEAGESAIERLSLNQVAAQAFLFFNAGYETSSSTMNFCLFELTKKPAIQAKVHAEIDRVCASRSAADFTSEAMGELEYLGWCIDEALRKYPIVPVLNRVCTKDFTFDGAANRQRVTIEAGTPVFVPVLAMQRDAEFYEDPMEFRPERFCDSASGNAKASGVCYAPFGVGNRSCIGTRMGKMQTKVGLAALLAKFRFEFVDSSYMNKEIEFNPKKFVMTPKEKIMLKAIPR